jgi:uncharacterized membrane protein
VADSTSRANANSPSRARAKQPRSPLAGPYGHPFHPILVTVPIGTWTASVIFDIIGLFAEDPSAYALAAQILIAIGIIGAVLAAVFGLLDMSQLERGTTARRTALTHMVANTIAIVLFAVSWAVRAGEGTDEVSIIGLVLSVIGLAVVGFSGWLGGKLAYRYGVRVADERTQDEGFR